MYVIQYRGHRLQQFLLFAFDQTDSLHLNKNTRMKSDNDLISASQIFRLFFSLHRFLDSLSEMEREKAVQFFGSAALYPFLKVQLRNIRERLCQTAGLFTNSYYITGDSKCERKVKFFRKTFLLSCQGKEPKEMNPFLRGFFSFIYIFSKTFKNNSESPGPSLVHDGGKQQADSG